MTSITLNVTGARIEAAVNGPLTSGMVGIPVTIRYDDAWNGLIKNLVCRCGKWGADRGETRTVLGIDESATVAQEVMQANKRLYLGVEGYSADGKLVIPTAWADCGLILYGANAEDDLSADPKLSVWAQLQAQIEQIKQDAVTEEDIAAAVAAYLEENPVEIPDSSQNANKGGGLSATASALLISILRNAIFGSDQSTDITALEAELLSDDSSGGSGDENTHTHSYVSMVTAAPTCTTAGVRTYTCSCGHSYTESIPATGHNYVDGICSVCAAASEGDENEKTLTGISATYTGGDVVAGTAVADLTGVVVVATYSDGSPEAVTGYTLSGTIGEGENIVTVTYEGMIATFTVTGVTETSGEDEASVVDAYSAYTWINGIMMSGPVGEAPRETSNDTYTTTDYISINSVEKIVVTEEVGGRLATYSVRFFDSSQLTFSIHDGYIRKDNETYPSPVEIAVPEGAAYFRITSNKEFVDGSNSTVLVKYSVYMA